MTELGSKEKRLRLGLGVFLLCLGLMLFELSLTRVLSVLYYYHTAFLAISVAMLGLGAGGLAAFLFSETIEKKRAKVLLGASLSMGILPFLFPVVELESGELEHFFGARFLLSLTITLVVIVLPFLAGGALLGVLFRRHKGDVARLYAFDMAGAALGALLLVPSMEHFGGAGAMYFAGAIVAAASLFLIPGLRLSFVVTGLMLAGSFLAGQGGLTTIRVDVSEDDRAETEILATRWNAFSRVVAIDHEGFDRGLSASRYDLHSGSLPPQIDALIDINAFAPMVAFDGDLGRVAHLTDVVSNLGYWIVDPGFDAAIIGPGGGKDVLGALLFDPRSITGIEINPILVDDFVKGEFKSFTGDIYNHEMVDIVVGDGRSELLRAGRKFDIIVANSVATWAAHSSGAMNLTESGLFTAEAFREYGSHLKDRGILSVSLWDEADHSLPMRLIETWKEAHGLGDHTGRHVVVFGNRWGENRWFTNVLMLKTAFTAEQLQRLKSVAADLDFDMIWCAGEGVDSLQDYFRDPSGFMASFRYDIAAASDDRPFFFYTVRLAEALRFWDQKARTDNVAWYSLVISFVLLIALVLILIAAPLCWMRRKSAGGVGLGWRKSIFFCLLGASFMLIEIALIQRLTLFLGHPTFALTVVLSGLLAWSGIGSLLVHRLAGHERFGRLKTVLFTLCLVSIPVWLLVPEPGSALCQQSAGLRILTGLLLLCPLGLLMGMPMPLALRTLGDQADETIPWAWGLNGAFGVLASVAAVIVAITCGFTWTYTLGGVGYLMALLAWPQAGACR